MPKRAIQQQNAERQCTTLTSESKRNAAVVCAWFSAPAGRAQACTAGFTVSQALLDTAASDVGTFRRERFIKLAQARESGTQKFVGQRCSPGLRGNGAGT
jgi:uncharacterized membrane protein